MFNILLKQSCIVARTENLFILVAIKKYDLNLHFRDKGLGCARYYLENLGNDKLGMDYAEDVNNDRLKCYQRCEIQSEHLTITSAEYPSKNTFENRDEMCLVVKKFAIICEDEIKFRIFEDFYKEQLSKIGGNFCNLVKSDINAKICEENFTVPSPETSIDEALYEFVVKYTRDNIVKVRFFFRDPYYESIRYDAAMTFTAFLGNIGGLVELCTGMSLISLIELFYYTPKVLANIQKKDQ